MLLHVGCIPVTGYISFKKVHEEIDTIKRLFTFGLEECLGLLLFFFFASCLHLILLL